MGRRFYFHPRSKIDFDEKVHSGHTTLPKKPIASKSASLVNPM
jgi:hypothetical protein